MYTNQIRKQKFNIQSFLFRILSWMYQHNWNMLYFLLEVLFKQLIDVHDIKIICMWLILQKNYYLNYLKPFYMMVNMNHILHLDIPEYQFINNTHTGFHCVFSDFTSSLQHCKQLIQYYVNTTQLKGLV